jgi:glucose-1-phosphate thymidylyltransferase
MKVIIPLAGKGTRLRPHTHSTPKPLLYVAGKPVLGHILDKLQEIGIKDLCITTGYLKEKVESYVTENYSFNAEFREQKVMDGSAGAVRIWKDRIDEPVLVIFVDTIFDTDLSFLKTTKLDGVVWVKEVLDYQRFGVVVNGKDGFIADMVEKPKEPISKLANIGLYYSRDYKLLFDCIEKLYADDMKMKGEYYLPDAYKLMIKKGQHFKAVEVAGWFDCGQRDTLLETNRILLQKRYDDLKKKGVDPNTGGSDAKISHSVLIPPVAIAEGAEITHSIVGPNVSIAKGVKVDFCIITDSIINERARLQRVELVDSLIGEDAVVIDTSKKLNVGDHSEIRIQHEDFA